MKPALYAALVSIGLSPQLHQAAGQAQEGGPADGPLSSYSPDDDTSAIQNGYFSYVSDMDSAESLRQAMETLSWASVGESWAAVAAATSAATSAEAQVPATPSSSSSSSPEAAPYATSEAAAAVQPEASNATTSVTKSSNTNTLALGLGIGIPLGLIALLSLAGALIYRKRKAYKKDFEKRTSNLRQMSQAEV